MSESLFGYLGITRVRKIPANDRGSMEEPLQLPTGGLTTLMPGLRSLLRLLVRCEQDEARTNENIHNLMRELRDKVDRGTLRDIQEPTK